MGNLARADERDAAKQWRDRIIMGEVGRPHPGRSVILCKDITCRYAQGSARVRRSTGNRVLRRDAARYAPQRIHQFVLQTAIYRTRVLDRIVDPERVVVVV